MAEPILKWAGGKRQILDAIKSCLPPEEDCGRYHEPFFGGGALFFRTAPHPPGSTVNDINERLMNFYRVVKEEPDALIEELRSFKHPTDPPNSSLDYHDKNYKGKEIDEFYYQQRELFNRRPRDLDFDPIEEAALLLYLNRTCFNGLYRENSSGEFNVPIGNYANPNWEQTQRINTAHRLLQDVDLKCDDFSYVEEVAEEGDLVYFDPPYKPVSKSSSFVEYHSESFGEEEQDRLRDLAVRLDEMGVHVVISNSPPIAEKYKHLGEFKVHDVGAKRHINSVGEDRGEVEEIVVTNVPEDNRREYSPNLGEWMEVQ